MDPTDQPVHLDDDQRQHLTKLAGHVSQATNQKTDIPDIQSPLEQEVLDENTKKAAEDYTGDEPEQDSKMGYLFPSLGKSTRTTKAFNFLSKKLEWLKKKSGGDVALKDGS